MFGLIDTLPAAGGAHTFMDKILDDKTFTSPTVSVLLPVYNTERFLRQALDSLLNQTFTDFELIAVNDGSKDGSLAILEEYAARDARVRVISRPNTGIVGALNDAFAASRGEFVARMDGDDESLPDRFAAQVQYLRSHPDCVMVGTQVVTIDEDDDDVAPLRGLETDHEGIDRALLTAGWPVVHPTVMMRRSALKSVGGYAQGTFPHEDHDLFLKMCEAGKVANLPDVLLRYRRHSASVSWDARSRNKMNEVMRAACERRGVPYVEPPAPPDAPDEPPRRRQGRIYRTWGWQALARRNLRTARKYALRSVGTAPLNPEAWKLLVCTIRGR